MLHGTVVKEFRRGRSNGQGSRGRQREFCGQKGFELGLKGEGTLESVHLGEGLSRMK